MCMQTWQESPPIVYRKMMILTPPVGRFHWVAGDACDEKPMYARVVSQAATPEHEAFLHRRYAGRRVVSTVGAPSFGPPPAGRKLVLVWEFLEKANAESLCSVFERVLTSGAIA